MLILLELEIIWLEQEHKVKLHQVGFAPKLILALQKQLYDASGKTLKVPMKIQMLMV
jgi:hypothetical protein